MNLLFEKKYLEALKDRCVNTGHLASLKVFLDIVESITIN